MMKPKMPKQTSIEWLEHKLNSVKPTDFCSIETIKEWLIEAKQMHKEEVIQAYREGRSDQQSGILKWYNRTSQQYFNQTFNKTTNDIE